ncbi:unnamed protein product [Lactuca saligna]|uniref:non-specific serine/threonine protein kinase n=1 Tax=Lactuca saligna TaxID=75948 RepID=A0AA35UK21_LACSI|nr:unnamed protein product [Lactuca saligna]
MLIATTFKHDASQLRIHNKNGSKQPPLSYIENHFRLPSLTLLERFLGFESTFNLIDNRSDALITFCYLSRILLMYQPKQLGLIHMKGYHRAGNPFVLPSQEGIDALKEVICQRYLSLSKLLSVGIAGIHWSGVDVQDNVLVLDLLGPSLEYLFVYCGRTFSLKTVLMLADQMLTRIELMQAKGFLHRDLKPDNFLMGLSRKANQVYVIDFGLAKRYRDPTTSCHIPYKENKNLTGTACYASCNTHLGIEQSWRDDLESLGYVFLYFLRGILPWQCLKGATKKQKYDKICEKKVSTPIEMVAYISRSNNDGPGCLTLRCPIPSCGAAVDVDMVNMNW